MYMNGVHVDWQVAFRIEFFNVTAALHLLSAVLPVSAALACLCVRRLSVTALFDHMVHLTVRNHREKAKVWSKRLRECKCFEVS